MLRFGGTSRKAAAAEGAQGFGFVELCAGGSHVSIVPTLGGKIASMEMAGRQWLWTSDVIPFRHPVDGSSYVETADSGGYDECFPTVGPCNLPPEVPRYGGLAIPDHGELWAQSAMVGVETHADGEGMAGPDADGLSVTCEWMGRRLPYRFARVVMMRSSGEVVMRYSVSNEGRDRFPFIWSAHPLLHLTEQTRLVLPEGARVRVYAQHGIDLFGKGAEHHWPKFRLEKNEVDLSQPYAVAKDYACKLFVDAPGGRASVEEVDARLTVTFDPAEVPNFGLWINRGGWSPFKRKRGYVNLGFEPCIGMPDTVTEALTSWNAAHWLEPGERRSWTLTWSAERLSPQ